MRVPAHGDETAAFEEALRDARIVLVGARCAEAIAPQALDAALASGDPLVMVIPDLDGARPTVDPARRVRRILGIEA